MIPNTYETKIYVTMSKTGKLSADECDFTCIGYTLLGTAEIQIPLDTSKDTLQKIIDSLDAEADEVRAKAEAALTEIEARKRELLSLPAPETD